MKIESECHFKEDGTKEDFPENETTLQWTNASCGISTVYGIPVRPLEFISKVLGPRTKTDRQTKEAFVLFSDVVYVNTDFRSAGVIVSTFLKDNPIFGTIVESPPRKNPNTGNTIQVWLWAVNHDSETKVVLEEMIQESRSSYK